MSLLRPALQFPRGRPSGDGSGGAQSRSPSLIRSLFRGAAYLFLLIGLAAIFNAWSHSEAGRVDSSQFLTRVERLARSEQLVVSTGGCIHLIPLDRAGPPTKIRDFGSTTPGGGWRVPSMCLVATRDGEASYFGHGDTFWRADRKGFVEQIFALGDLDPELLRGFKAPSFDLHSVDHERGRLYGKIGGYPVRIELGTNHCEFIRCENIYDFAWSDDGETLYCVELARGSWRVCARDFAGGAHPLLNLERIYWEVELSPDGNKLLVAAGSGRDDRLLILDLPSGRSETLPAIGGTAKWLDDERILFVTGTRRLAEYSLVTGTERTLLQVTGRSSRRHDSPLALSRNRTLVAWTFCTRTMFTGYEWGNTRHVIFPPKFGTVLIDLERGEFDLMDPYLVTAPNGMTFEADHAGRAGWLDPAGN